MATTEHGRLHAVLSAYDMQTGFFYRALDGISNNDTHQRLDTKANHIAWLTGALVAQRFELAGLLGIDKKQTAHELFANNKGIQEGATYPTLEEYRKDWEAISPVLRDKLATVSDEELERPIPMGPDQSFPLYDMITFTNYREANIIGQIALWRRLLDYPAMSYM